jgi:selT/selW/selH-like putative selenoprotein
VAKFLEDKFPELRGHITGGLYPAPPIAEFFTSVLSVCQFIGIAWMMVGGDKLLRMLPFYRTGPLPAFYWTIQDNPIPLAIALFLLAPQFIGKLQANGAFEIYLDNEDTIIFSKLKTGALPTADQLIEGLVAAGLKLHSET